MKVIGPNWPSTKALQAALQDVQSSRVVHWGQGSKYNKLSAIEQWVAAGIPTVSVTRDLMEAKRLVGLGKVIWGRKLRHTQGRDIVQRAKFLSRRGNHLWSKRWMGRDFWVEFTPSLRDWRVHVFEGHAFRTGVKIYTEGAEEGASPIRSDLHGWQINYSKERMDGLLPRATRKAMRDLAERACGAIGVATGAVDILEAADGSLHILEVNTAPALGEMTLAAYVERIKVWAMEAPAPAAPAPPVDYYPQEEEDEE